LPLAHAQDHASGLLYIPFVFWTFAHGFSLGPSVAELHAANKIAAFLDHWPVILTLGAIYGLVAFFAVGHLWRSPTRLFYLLGLVVPTAVVSTALEIAGSSVIPRYAMMCVPIFWLLVATALVGEGLNRMRALVIWLLVGVNLFAVFQLQFDPRYHKEDYRSVQHLISHQAPNLPVFVVGPVGGAAVVLKYYGLSVAQEVPDAATGAGARAKTVGAGGYWVVADGARAWAWDPDGAVIDSLLEDRQWERTLFGALQIYRVHKSSARELARSSVN
jgi:hypothetical protein